MEYYSRPEGTERMLRSRIRRGFVALAELKPAIEILEERVVCLCEEVAEENLGRTSVTYHQGYIAMTGVIAGSTINQEKGIQQAQERLLTKPEAAEEVCRYTERINDDVNGVIRNLAYRVDAGIVEPNDSHYQTTREQAIKILGLTEVVIKSIEPGFVRDARRYQLFGE